MHHNVPVNLPAGHTPPYAGAERPFWRWLVPPVTPLPHGQRTGATCPTWPGAPARNYMAFAAQRILVAVHIAAAQEIAEALGLSVAADPRVSGLGPLGDGGGWRWAWTDILLDTHHMRGGCEER